MRFRLFSKLPTNFPLFVNSYFRQISTQFTIAPDIVEAMYEGTQIESSNLVPNFQQINKHQEVLKKLYQKNPEFKKFADNLFKARNNPNVKSIAFSFVKKNNSDDSKKNPYFQPTLLAVSLLHGVGLVPFYNERHFPSFALVNKNNIKAISGHQDGMFLGPDDIQTILVQYLLLVNGFSQSNAKTWIKESADVIKEFKEKHSSSYQILKTIKFTSRSRSVEEVGHRIPYKIIGENDEIDFVSNFIYLPSPIDLDNYFVSKEGADLAILNFKNVVNSELNRCEFIFNNDGGVQFLVIKNKEAIHGRGPIEEKFMGQRSIIGIALQDQKPSTAIKISAETTKISEQKNDKLR